MIRVELFCKHERLTIADIELDGSLDAASIRAGMKSRVPNSVPEDISDNEQMICRRCKCGLWFKTAQQMIQAIPTKAMEAQ